MMVLSGIMMAGLSVWQFLPLVIPNGWQGYESFVSLAVFIPSAFSIIGFLVFYVHKYKGKKYANTLVLNLLAPLLFTVLLLVSIALILGWLVIMAIGLLDKSINMPRDSSDGPQQSVRIWGTGDDFNDVTHSDSYYSSRHGCHVDEYRDERGNKYLSPDGGNTFYEDN
ncbi:MAG: hypothetical protein IKC47_04710 [Clostridia bacterium]|nr:hypothetical protein [Clostridia bacterium]